MLFSISINNRHRDYHAWKFHCHWIYYYYYDDYYDYDDDFVWEQRTRRTRSVRRPLKTASSSQALATLHGADVKMASPTKESRPKDPHT